MTPAEKLLNQYEEAVKAAAVNLDDYPIKNRPGMEMRKRESATELPKIRQQYGEIIQAKAFGIFLEGDPQSSAEFARVASEEASTINVSADGLYQTLADGIEESMGTRRTFGTTQLGLLIGALTEVGRELDFRNIPMPQIFDVAICADRAALVNTVREMVRAVVGDRLNLLWVSQHMIQAALSIRYTRSVVPVIVTNATADERQELSKSLFNGTTFTVPVTAETVSSEHVLKALAEIRESLKSKKS